MIIHEFIEMYDKDSVSFPFLLLIGNMKNGKMFFSRTISCYVNWMFFLVFITKITNANAILFFQFWNVSNFDWNFYVFNIELFPKIFSAFVTFAGWWSAGFMYMTKLHLKRSLSSIFWILINDFLAWSNSFSNLI